MSYEIVGIQNHGSIVTLLLSEQDGPGFRFIHGDHRPMRQFLEGWSASDYPLVDVTKDGSIRMEV